MIATIRTNSQIYIVPGVIDVGKFMMFCRFRSRCRSDPRDRYRAGTIHSNRLVETFLRPRPSDGLRTWCEVAGNLGNARKFYHDCRRSVTGIHWCIGAVFFPACDPRAPGCVA